MRVSARDGLALEVDVRGQGAPVLLLHGFGGAGAAWGEVARRLAESHRVIAPDLIGHGGSGDPKEPERVFVERVLEDLDRVLDAAGVDACTWIGYSMGGRIALAAALLRAERVRALVLESSSPGLVSEEERRARRMLDNELAGRIEHHGVATWVEDWESHPLFARRRELPPEVRDPFLALRRDNRAESLAVWLRGFGVGAQASYWSRLGEIRVPVLLLTGAEDPRYEEIARAMAERLPEARHESVPGIGHTVHLEAPGRWLTAVEAFLAEPPAKSPGR